MWHGRSLPDRERELRVSPPAGWDGTTPLPTAFFFHGYGGSADGEMQRHEPAEGLLRRRHPSRLRERGQQGLVLSRLARPAARRLRLCRSGPGRRPLPLAGRRTASVGHRLLRGRLDGLGGGLLSRRQVPGLCGGVGGLLGRHPGRLPDRPGGSPADPRPDRQHGAARGPGDPPGLSPERRLRLARPAARGRRLPQQSDGLRHRPALSSAAAGPAAAAAGSSSSASMPAATCCRPAGFRWHGAGFRRSRPAPGREQDAATGSDIPGADAGSRHPCRSDRAGC